MLDSTATAGANQLTLLPQPDGFDWAVGEEIVIASTDYDHTHSETAFISDIETLLADVGLAAGTPKRRVLTLDRALVY